MSNDNRISAELTPAAVTSIQNSVGSVRAQLPFLVSLSNDERRQLPKLGDNRLALDEDGWTLMNNHPSLVPGYVDLAELAKDRVLRAKLDEVRLSLQALLNDIEGTEMVLGSEMLMAYLAFYANAQQGAKRGVPGAQAIVDVLSKYFARKPRTPAPATPPGNNP
jgi:hypothetical protein